MSKATNDTQRGMRRRTIVVPIAVALCVMLVAGILVDRQNYQITEARLRAETMAQLSVIRAKLEGNVSGNIQLVKGLAATIATEPDMQQERYEELVQNLFVEDSQLKSVAASPDLIVTMTYPIEPNRAVIGLNYRETPEQWEAVRRVVETGELTIAGPLDLVQGGRGLVGRFPVYTGTGSTRTLWGVISAVIDIDRLYADSGVLDPDLSFDLSITGRDGTGGDGALFFGPDLSGLNPVTANVVLPSGSWQLAAVPKRGWAPEPMAVWALRGMILVAGCLVLLPIFATARMVHLRHEHIREMARREAELSRVSRRLELALDVSKVGVWEMDPATGDEIWDDRTYQFYGLTPDQGPRTTEDWRQLVHPSDRERAGSDFERVIAAGRYESEYRIIHTDGGVRHIRSIATLFQEPGEPDKVIGVNWDVTADVARNEELRQATQIARARNAELEAARVRIEHNALHDSLTGLPNRRYLDEMLKRHASDGFHGSGSIALLHIDLDRFKQINDTLGHAAGDAMLIHASRVLRANCRETDFVARIGGDEFVIVSSAGSNDKRLSAMADRIVKEMRKPAVHEGHQCRFGVSIGVATSRDAGIDVKQLLINADIALYRAKARGRNRFEFYSEALQAEVIRTKRVADEILNSLDGDAFFAHYQPQFDAQTLDLVGVEALARWQHPKEGLKYPDYFMSVAEELNVMSQIDHAVLVHALADLKRWDEMGLSVPRASVNVSLRRLHDEGLVETLRALNMERGRIAFELVESIYLDENDGVVSWNIDQIKDLGIDVEIDDFGTGYASIVSLQKLHPRRLKIDRQLVMPILDQPAQRKLVASIVDIGKSMDIEIVAEGVESMEHARILRDLGCDILQGYAFAKPMQREDFETFLATQAWREAS